MNSGLEIAFTCVLMVLALSETSGVTSDSEPTFDVTMVNVTVKEAGTAVLPCSVRYLGAHQVVWTDQWSTLLTFEDRRIIDDERISVERPYTKDWNLHIRSVRSTDGGVYNCQINTSPVKIKIVNLVIQVPARIVDDLSSSDVTAVEGETITLVCNVTGNPLPTVTWYRHPPNEDGEKERIGIDGEMLLIHNVSRYCGDTYECMAYNDVPPAVTRQIKVTVQFPPEVRLPNRRMGQEIGKETILECTISASPHEISVWLRNGQELSNSFKYKIDVYENEESHTLTLSLRVRNIELSDFGKYTCMSSNILGTDKETMTLYDYTMYTKSTRRVYTTPLYFPTTTTLFPPPVLNPPEHRGRTELQFVTIRQTTKHIPVNQGYPRGPQETRNTAVRVSTATRFIIIAWILTIPKLL